MWLNHIVKFVTHYLKVTTIFCWIFSHIWIWNVWQLKSKFETLVTYEFKSDKYMSHTLTVWPNVIYGHTFTFIVQMAQILISPSHIFTNPAHFFFPKTKLLFFPKIKFTFSLSLHLGHITPKIKFTFTFVSLSLFTANLFLFIFLRSHMIYKQKKRKTKTPLLTYPSR